MTMFERVKFISKKRGMSLIHVLIIFMYKNKPHHQLR